MRITLLGVLVLLGAGFLVIYVVYEVQRWVDQAKVQTDEPISGGNIVPYGTGNF